MRSMFCLTLATAAAIGGGAATAEPVSVEALLTPQEKMRFNFPSGSNHFVLAVRREGTAEGSGVFDGADVTEFGWHDVNPPISGAPRGYLQMTAENGDIAMLQWNVRATFMKGDDGPALFDNGVWELVSGTGQFEDMRGVGSLVIRPTDDGNRFILEGDVGEKP